MKRIITIMIIMIMGLSVVNAITDNNNIAMSLSANSGGGGFVIEPLENMNIENLVLHPGVNANTVYILENSNLIYSGVNSNININLNKNVQYVIYVDSQGSIYNRYYMAQNFPFNSEYIKYVAGWHNGLNVQQNNAFNIVGFNINLINETEIIEEPIKDIWLLIGQSNCNGQGTTLNQLVDGSSSKVYNLNDQYLKASDKNFNINVNHGGTIFPLLSNKFYENHNYSVDYIMTCVSGSRISQWEKGSSNYNKMLEQVSEFTNNSNEIKGIIMIQGEAEAHNQNVVNYGVGYNEYKTYLNNLVIDLNNDLNIETNNLFITIIDRNDTNTNSNYLQQIQNAQLDSITENNNISLFADMRNVGSDDNVHFMSDYQMGTFAQKGYDNLKNHISIDSNISITEPETTPEEEISHNMSIYLAEGENICLNEDNINIIDIIKLLFMYSIYGGNN